MSNNHRTAEPALATWTRYGIYLTAFMPLVIFRDFLSPFHFGKIFLFRSLIEILAVFYIVLLIRYGKEFLPRRTPLFWAITLFTIIFGITTFTSVNLYQSFWGTLERMGGWFSFIHFWGFFVMASAILKRREHWLTFIKLSLFVSLLSAFYGFLQKTDLQFIVGSGGRSKIFGTIGNPALFAGYMIVNTFLALTFYFRAGISKNEKRFYGAVFLLDTLAILLTGVRGSVLAIVVGIGLFGFLYSMNFSSLKIKRYTIAFLVLVLIVAGTLYLLRNTDFVKNNQYLARYSDISPKAYTVQTRAWAWQAGFNGWNDSSKTIVFGWGPEMFNIPFSKHFNPQFFRGIGSETLFDRAHNQFLEVLFTMGLIGFLAYILIFIFSFREVRALNSNPEANVFRIGLISTLVAYMIHNSFIFDTAANFLMFFLILGFINYFAVSKNQPESAALRTYQPKRSGLAYAAGLILAVLAIISINLFEIQPARANFTTTRAILASWDSNHDLAFQKFKEAMSFDTFGKYEIRHRYAQYMLEQANRVNEVDEKMAERLLVAIENAKKNIAEYPQDYVPHLYVSRSYILLGKQDSQSEFNDLALEHSMRALDISPTYIRTYYEIAQVYLNRKDYPTAIEWFEKAAKLNPEVALSHWYIGITFAQMGELERGAKIIEDSGYPYLSNEVDALRMSELYLRLRNFHKLAEVYEALIKLNPRNPQYHASLAVAYKEIGEKEKAIREARIAAQLDPAYAAEAERFINSLR